MDFLTFTLRPWLVRIERAVSGLLPSTQRAKFNAGGFLRATQREQYEALSVGVAGGFVTPMRPAKSSTCHRWPVSTGRRPRRGIA